MRDCRLHSATNPHPTGRSISKTAVARHLQLFGL